MAPPIPGLQRAPVRSRRSAGDVLFGLLAVIVLVALIGGVPLGLLAVFGSPIPHTVPAMSALTHQITVSAVLKILAVVVWLAWVPLIVCVFAEVRAAGQDVAFALGLGHQGDGVLDVFRHPVLDFAHARASPAIPF